MVLFSFLPEKISLKFALVAAGQVEVAGGELQLEEGSSNQSCFAMLMNVLVRPMMTIKVPERGKLRGRGAVQP
jgi:hypothetical protein